MGVLESLMIWMFVACICWVGITALENTLAATVDGKGKSLNLRAAAYSLLITPVKAALSAIGSLIRR